ncbi:MAG: bifunctional folylpolyglutamate synthase/dihydrofolate synthase [Brevinematales bacterium]|nr:bifunctional folylpolyglutamate synthase/dihydrofolate synthase [Brevinematales bacterium]
MNDALQFLESLINFERSLVKYGDNAYDPGKLKRILGRFSYEALPFGIIHIAGTKGKGSTANYCAELLGAADGPVGLYTSPHLVRLNERITVDGVPITDGELSDIIMRRRDGITAERLTYFEALTFIAIIHFIMKQCRWVALETGMGGRLDATNFCVPAVSVITPISFDHTKYLGNTLEAIAGEKAGIVKQGIPVVCGPQADEAMKPIIEAARRKNAPVIRFDDAVSYKITARSPEGSTVDAAVNAGGKSVAVDGLKIAQAGDVFAVNFLTALAAALAAGVTPAEAAIRRAASVKIPGRIERAGNIILDVSHNDASLRALFSALREYYGLERVDLYIGTLADKEIGRIAECIHADAGMFGAVGVFDFPTEGERKSGGAALYEMLKDIPDCAYYADPRDIPLDGGNISVFTGSFYAYPILKEIARSAG